MISEQKILYSFFSAQYLNRSPLLVVILLFISSLARAQDHTRIDLTASSFNQSDLDRDLYGSQFGSQLRIPWKKNSALTMGLRAQFPLLRLNKNSTDDEAVAFLGLQNGELQFYFSGLTFIDRGSIADIYLDAEAIFALRPRAALQEDLLLNGLALGAALSLGIDLLSYKCCKPGVFFRYAAMTSPLELVTNKPPSNSLSVGLSLGFDLI